MNPPSSQAYAKALRESTLPTTLTQWDDEQWDVPPIKDSDRAHYQSWLEASGFLAASDHRKWEAICKNWISFLSATSLMPKLALAPRRKVIIFGTQDRESAKERLLRFHGDRRLRYSTQQALWNKFDNLESLSESWPAKARLVVNQSGVAGGAGVFESWAAKVNLGKRRRGNSMWSSLICFLAHSYDGGTLQEMGLDVSEEMGECILDISAAFIGYGATGLEPSDMDGLIRGAVKQLAIEFITDHNATATTNPLLWWIGVLVQSSLRTGADDYISRGRFNLNILPMDVDIQARVEALLHYSKVLILDHTMMTWDDDEIHQRLVRTDMAGLDKEWLNADDDQRPKVVINERDCSSPAWQLILKHLRGHCYAYLGKKEGTVVRQIRLLLEK